METSRLTGCRVRPGTGKRLLLIRCDGELSKDAFAVKEWIDEDTGKTKRWLVESLADGQQFIAAGTHTSGDRYEWRDGIPSPADVPVVDMGDLLELREALKEKFACAEWKTRKRHDPTLLEDMNVEDPVAEHLIENGLVVGEGKDKLFIECPWSDGHSSDNGETQTAWLLAGTGKYRNGHFKCMHAGCADKGDQAFFTEVGYRRTKPEDFDDLTQDDGGVQLYQQLAPAAAARARELRLSSDLRLPSFDRDGQGRIVTNLDNLYRALDARHVAECDVAYDEFRSEHMIAERPAEWRTLTDADTIRLRARLERIGFKDKIGRELMRDALEWIGDERRFDSAKLWLEKVVPDWDGVPRIARFWPDYMNTEDSAYTRALGLYSWTAQAGRILDPGCQVDMVPVLVSPEGYAKTSVIAALAPSRDFFAEFNLGHDDDQLARLMRGTLVGELAELRGISVRDGEAVKSWVTRREEKWTPKYKEYATSLARRLVLYGTTNDPDFLQAHMGERRWLPVQIQAPVVLGRVKRDLLQLWAEARDHWHAEGVEWQKVEELARAQREPFRHIHPWTEPIATWVDCEAELDGLTPRSSGRLTAEWVLTEVVGLPLERQGRRQQQEVAAILRSLGMVPTQRKVDGRNRNVWIDRRLDEFAAGRLSDRAHKPSAQERRRRDVVGNRASAKIKQ